MKTVRAGLSRLTGVKQTAITWRREVSYHLPVLSAEQNDSQSEEIDVIDESQAENRPVPMQEAEIRLKKVFLVGR